MLSLITHPWNEFISLVEKEKAERGKEVSGKGEGIFERKKKKPPPPQPCSERQGAARDQECGDSARSPSPQLKFWFRLV